MTKYDNLDICDIMIWMPLVMQIRKDDHTPTPIGGFLAPPAEPSTSVTNIKRPQAPLTDQGAPRSIRNRNNPKVIQQLVKWRVKYRCQYRDGLAARRRCSRGGGLMRCDMQLTAQRITKAALILVFVQFYV